MKTYIQPITQVTKAALLNAVLSISGGGSTNMNVVDQPSTQQSGAMSPGRKLYI